MSILQTEIIETLDALVGPLGAQTSLAERLERQDRWVNEGGVELLEALLAVVASPPPEEQLKYASLDDWNTLLVEVTGALGRRHPEVALQRLLPLLDDEQARPTAIDILGSVGDARALPRLGQLMQSRRFGDDDLYPRSGYRVHDARYRPLEARRHPREDQRLPHRRWCRGHGHRREVSPHRRTAR